MGWFTAEGKRLADASVRVPSSWRTDGEEAVSYDAGSVYRLRRDGEIEQQRRVNGDNCSHPDWRPQGNLIAVPTSQSKVTAWRAEHLQPHWHTVMLPEGKSATFSAAGELMNPHPGEVDPYLVYYVDRGDGKIEMMQPAEFRRLVEDADRVTK